MPMSSHAFDRPVALVGPAGRLPAPAAGCERSEIPDQYKWDLAALYAGRGRLDRRQAGARAGDSGARRSGRASSASRPATLLAAMTAWEQRQPAGRSPVRLRLPAVRPGHARRPQHADAAGSDAGLHRASSRRPRSCGRRSSRSAARRSTRYLAAGAEARPVPDVLRRHPARGAAHADAGRGEDRRAQPG